MITQELNLPAINDKQIVQLNQLLTSLTNEQKLWLGGYLTGLNESTNSLLKLLNQNTNIGSLNNVPHPDSKPDLIIFFGTRSGNSKKLAIKTNKQANALGINTKLIDLNEYDPKQIKKEKNILLILSTDGEGEPPASVEEFYNYIYSKKAPQLKNLKYSVLALGDKTYKHFCKTGKDIDERLAELGANRIIDRIDCDLDYEENSSVWITNVLSKQSLANSNSGGQNLSIPEASPTAGSKESPYKAELINKILLNGKGSSKKTWHLEFSIEDSGIKYSPGDSLGIICHNNAKFVSYFISETGLQNKEIINTYKGDLSLEDALTKFYEISRLVPSVIIDIAQITNNIELKKLINKPEELEQYCYGRDVLDLILDFNLKLSAQELIKNLRKLQPRLYSISSSFNYNQDEVHLTVSQVEYQTNRRKRKGVSSNYLSSINEDDTVEIFVDENISFRLPEDPQTPIIMIGAGTGVAPYRAFLQERSLADIKTKNWLFLGERNFVTDFLYQTEWLRYHKNGLLTKIDLAFSRDQEEKKYVQHKLLENSKEIYKWVNEGAIVYLCGDKNTMAKDVKSTLVEIFQNEGGLSAGSAADYLRKLRRDKQFQEDVY